jgi:hypothetical protein
MISAYPIQGCFGGSSLMNISNVIANLQIGSAKQGDDADRFWMYTIEGTKEEVHRYFWSFVDAPAIEVGRALGKELKFVPESKKSMVEQMHGIKLFNPNYPVTLVFQYGYTNKSVKKGLVQYVIKGEYKTNFITISCPPYTETVSKEILDRFTDKVVIQVDVTFVEPLGKVYTHFDINTEKTGNEELDQVICYNLSRRLMEPSIIPLILNRNIEKADIRVQKSDGKIIKCPTKKINFSIPKSSKQMSAYELVYVAAPPSQKSMLYHPAPVDEKKQPTDQSNFLRTAVHRPEASVMSVESAFLEPCLKSDAGYVIGVNTSFNNANGNTYVAVGIDSTHLSGWNFIPATTSE